MPNKTQSPKSKKHFNIKSFVIHLAFGFWTLAFLFSTPAFAQIDLTNGYTLHSNDQQAQITIAPNTLNRVVYLDLQEAKDYPTLPLDKTLASKIYSYSLLPAGDNRLTYPITVAARFQDTSDRFKEIFIYDTADDKWKHLTGGIDPDKKELAAQTTLASGYLAVLSDKIDRAEYLKEELNSPTILVADAVSGEILVERNSSVARPIASLTKMMTAAVFLDNNPGWKKIVTMQKSDDTIPAKIYVKTGDKISTRDLWFATLVHSANNAARALARSTGLSAAEFVKQMNAKAKALGMANTKFVEPTGLSGDNVSTAADYLKLTQAVLKNSLFLQATTLKQYRLTVKRGKKTIRLTTANSNKILNSPFIITGSKTGYTDEAGRCLMIRAKNKNNREVIAIILGATVPGKQWTDMNSLLAAALDNSDSYKVANQ